eukprot:1155814-Pelagomonas_calceolata.AAC.2
MGGRTSGKKSRCICKVAKLLAIMDACDKMGVDVNAGQVRGNYRLSLRSRCDAQDIREAHWWKLSIKMIQFSMPDTQASRLLQQQLPFSRATLTASLTACLLHQIKEQSLYPELHRQHVQGHILKIIIQLVRISPTPTYLYKVNSHAGTAGNERADAVAKHQAIQGNSTPADTTFPCVNLEGTPVHDTTWLAFENPSAHMQALQCPNSTALKLKRFTSLHDALRVHMHSKHRLGKADIETGYYSYWQNLLPRVHESQSWVLDCASISFSK